MQALNRWLSFRILVVASCMATAHSLRAGDSTGVAFSFAKERIGDGQVVLSIKAVIARGLKLYGLKTGVNDALYSSIVFDKSSKRYLDGEVVETGRRMSEKDASLGTMVYYYGDSVVWRQKVRASLIDSFLMKGVVDVMVKKGDEYIPEEKAFRIFIRTGSDPGADNSIKVKSLWWIFLTAFAGGLLALLTPCVYSMIPITVSFFTKRSRTQREGIKNAILYSSSIVVIFTLLGFLITLVFGPAALNGLATNWIANLIFFVLFVIFGISFLGAFEIALPSSWSTGSDRKAGISSFTGIFFMALTLVVVSFSCTGPIIGNLLVLAAEGNYYGPLTGMFGFSVALGLPFAFFAFFPGKLNVLSEAGGWLNAIKITLGFLELALALKFLSNADLAKGWRLLDREVFIVAWAVIFGLLGLYLLGKIKFRHDDELPKNDFGYPFLSVPRLLFVILTFSFTLYLIPGLWGAPLKAISAFIPPMGTQDFNSGAIGVTAVDGAAMAEQPLTRPLKYYGQMKMYEPQVVTQFGMITYFDYDEGLAAARMAHKPLMLDFTGINCVNCRKMEGQVWSDPTVMKILKNDFVIASLYVDANNIDLQETEQYFSKELGKDVQTLGDKNTDLQVTRFGANSQPYYFFLDNHGEKLIQDGYGYDPDIDKFLTQLHKVLDAYKR